MDIQRNTYQKNLPLILVVDDEKSVRSLLSRAMEQEGYQVAEACDGRECLEIFLDLNPDMVLLDGMMPVMDGITCCRHLQALPGGDRVPILIITGLEDQGSVDQAFEAGATDYVTKPIHLPVLCQRVKRLLQESWAMEELRQQTEREKLLRTITQKIFQQSLKSDEILNTTVAEVREFLQADRAVICQLTYSGDGVVLAESVGASWATLREEIIPKAWFERQILRYREGACWVVDDFQQIDLSEQLLEFLNMYQIASAVEVPILEQDGQLWGLIATHQCYKSRSWKNAEIEALKQLSTQVAIAMKQSQLYEHVERVNQSLKRLASLDGLTQVANRRRFNDYLDQEWRRLTQEQLPMSLLLGDVDYFKPYNDHYGHLAGDSCLKQVAAAIGRAVKRPSDLLARYGGEEFAVILPNTAADVAMKIAQVVHTSVKEPKLPTNARTWDALLALVWEWRV